MPAFSENLLGTNITMQSFSRFYQKSLMGFTLVELLVTLAVIAIVVGMGAPSFRSTIQNNRAATQTNELIGAMSFARSEAARRAREVNISSVSGNTAWQGGFRVWIDFNGSNTYDDGEEVRVFDSLSGGTTLTATVNRIRFLPSGFLNHPASANISFQLRTPDCSGTEAKNLVISPTGRTSVTKVACS